MSYKTGNPTLSDDVFARNREEGSVMTLEGTATKTLFLLAIVVCTAFFTWKETAHLLIHNDVGVVEQENRINTLTTVPAPIWAYVLIGSLGGFFVALFTIFNPRLAAIGSCIYAGLEGVALGAWSMVFEWMYPNIIAQAVGLTFGVLFVMLLAYRLHLVRATENFKLAVIAATGAICVVYLVDLCLIWFANVRVPLIHETGVGGIVLSLVVVGIASANLVLDFDFIERGVENKSAKYMEWYAAFSLLVTLVWLYLEIVRLLAKAKSNK